MFYVFVLVLPYTNGNVIKSFIVGLVMIVAGLYMVTIIAPAFTLAADDVYKVTGDGAVAIPQGFEAGALDFSSSPLGFVIYQLSVHLKEIGAGILVLLTCGLMWWNRVLIIKNQKEMVEKGATTLQTME